MTEVRATGSNPIMPDPLEGTTNTVSGNKLKAYRDAMEKQAEVKDAPVNNIKREVPKDERGKNGIDIKKWFYELFGKDKSETRCQDPECGGAKNVINKKDDQTQKSGEFMYPWYKENSSLKKTSAPNKKEEAKNVQDYAPKCKVVRENGHTRIEYKNSDL